MSKHTVIVGYFYDFSEIGYREGEKEYFNSYREFSQLCHRNNIDFYVALQREYQGNMKFSRVFTLTPTGLVAMPGPIVADIIYDKNVLSNRFLPATTSGTIVNHPALDKMARDKYLTYKIFSKYMAKTHPINLRNWRSVVRKIGTSKIVIKPIFGTEGRGITVAEKSEFDFTTIDQSFGPFMAQEFVDSRGGVPGIMKGLHDLRLYIFNGEIKFAEIREPKRGSYLANIAQGGSLTMIPLAKVPESAHKFLSIVERKFKKYFPRIYTIDLIYEGKQPYIVELNSKPGLPFREWEVYDNFYSKFHRYLLETLLSSQKNS